MNRRVLLIDSDPAFRDTLTRELARYKVVVMTEADADRALALANADSPALIVLCIEEPDKKAGFRVFEKCKKGTLSKVPIILVTGSVPADSFAKHRSLRVHADEYIDKRTMSTHELVGKIDGLIALGDPEDEEDLSIPLEDEIPMEIADGDVMLDEVVGDAEDAQPTLLAHEPLASEPEAHDEFDQNEARTVGPKDGLTVDSVVEAETDAAFDALMGGFGDEPEPLPEPEPQAIAEAGEHREESIAMPPVEAELSPVELAVDPTLGSTFGSRLGEVPEPIIDGRGRGTTPPPLLAESVPGIIIDQPPMRDDHHGRAQAIPAIELEPALDEAIPEAVPHQEPGLPAGQFDPAPLEVHDEEPLVADAMSGTIDVGLLADLADAELPAEQVAHEPVAHEEQRQQTDVYMAHEDVAEEEVSTSHEHHERLESQPAIMIDDDELVPMDDDLPVEVEEPDEPALVSSPVPRADHDEATSVAAVPRAPILPEVDMRTPPRGGSGSHPAIDLGLDVVAQDAQSEQSGVYDRRALRKIGELERQISQLKVELERARMAGEAAAKGGRESQFLHLRESMLAKDKELKQFKSDLANRESELAEATEKMRQAVAARTTLEAKEAELEKRASDEGAKAHKLAATGKASESQVAQLQQELAAAQKTAKDSESARQQLDKELATERATGKASASETERLLRTEREQIAQRHASELASARTDVETSKQAAVALLREELEAAHGTALEEQIEALRRANAAEHDATLNALEQQHASATVALKADHAGEHSRIKSDLSSQISQLEGALLAAEASHEQAVTSAMGANAAALEQQAEAHVAELARQRTDHAVAIEEQERAHATAIAETERAHAALLAETTQAAAGAASERERAVAAATNERDRTIANAKVESDRALAAAHAENDRAMVDLKAAHVAALADKDSAHSDTIAELQQTTAEALAEKDEAAVELVGAHAAALAAKDTAARDQAQEHADKLADAQTESERARAGHEVKLDSAKRELDDTVAKHEQARGEIVEQHRSALADLAARHEQELAKAAADRDQLADAARRAADTHRTALADGQAQQAAELQQVAESAGREVAEHKAAAAAARRAIEEATARHTAEREEASKAHAQAIADTEAKVERQLAIANGEFLKQKSVADAEHVRALAAHVADAEKTRTDLLAEHGKVVKETSAERDELKRGLSSARDSLKRSEGELASAVQSIADRNAELRQHAAAVTERDQRLAELRKEIETLEAENTSYQEQVLRAYQKMKTDEAMVARARKAMAIALTVLDDQGNPKET